MMSGRRLRLYQEVLLLSLRDERGTAEWGAWTAQAMGAGVLADLLLEERIRLEGKNRLVTLVRSDTLGEPVLDECLARIGAASRRAAAQSWIGRFGTKKLFHAGAGRLCELGVLRVEPHRVLQIFTRRTYPEIDPGPENELVERLREAICGDREDLEPRTVVLLSIAAATQLLPIHFPKDVLRNRKARIERVKSGEAVGQAAASAVQAVHAAIMVAAVLPVIAAAAS